jgi:exodeoxyribonuclease V alpha subunit
MGEQGQSLLDIHFAGFLAERAGLSGALQVRFQELVQALTASLQAGHSCLQVTPVEEQLLKSSKLVSPGGATPLVLHKKRLYLNRYFHYEKRLAEQIGSMASRDCVFTDNSSSAEDVGAVAAGDLQQMAARIALQKYLTIICGGPGTGKTTTVVKIIVFLLQAVSSDLKIGLAAPTGKAAMRLSESVSRSLAAMDVAEEIRAAVPGKAVTLHRLMGARRNSPRFIHTKVHPMGWDVVVVDEASMVDLAMMSKLVDGLKPGARLLLLGDKDQLASVESGSVLSDLISVLPENSVELLKTYRFDDNIKRLAESVKKGDVDYAWRLLLDAEVSNVSLIPSDPINYIADKYRSFMEEVHQGESVDIADIFQTFTRFQVLCGVHHGSRGVSSINKRVELHLARQGFGCEPGRWYSGRPVLVTQNDYSLDLFNGDIGICMRDGNSEETRVWFQRGDGSLRSYSPWRLPRCETVYAMTIHKSQGSEFDEVLVLLPEEDNRILSRELIYTAITRAKKVVRITGDKDILGVALARNIIRTSGLTDFLKEVLARDF